MKRIIDVIRHPRAAVIVHDFCMVAVAWFIAVWLIESTSALTVSSNSATLTGLLIVLVLQGSVLWATGLYKGLWRFASFPDMWNIARASIFGTVAIMAVLGLVEGPRISQWMPMVLIYPVLLFVLLGLPRMCYRFWKDSQVAVVPSGKGFKRVLIIGAGRSGAMLERELRRRGGFDVVGFLDDDERLRGAQVHGVPVLGSIDKLPGIGAAYKAELSIIAMPSATNQQMQRIVEICELSEVEFRTLPTLQDIGSQATNIGDLKRVVIDDLLGREPVSLEWESIRAGLVGKRVMITGGGGSIGSELCRQIARLNPVELIVVDHSEYSLYKIDHELHSDYHDLLFHSVLGDICDPATVEKVIGDYKPDVVFHAAAYKHLPILQTQVREAFRNNVFGTMRVAEAAERHGVGTFVLISTDKAVNPANIMGATKRVAEMYCQNMNARSEMRFITVRFGNVLNSNGSVVPLFQEQIAKGGPVTVTHPEISRYFMTISEASQLIMQAAVLGSGGEIYVLDMGEPVNITYLAEHLIRLAGKEPGRDIEIIYTGLRPGEKLFEQLFHELEPYERTSHEKILLAHPRLADWNELRSELTSSELAVRRYDTKYLQQALVRLVPELAKSGSNTEPSKVTPIYKSR
ncbi:MAG: nucleoside-diphosphate sugar epimerase/dehydratase [Lysobacterales bacterium]